MSRVSISNLRENQNSNSQMLQGPNLPPNTFSAFHHLTVLSMTNYNQGGHLHSHHLYARVVMFEEKKIEETSKNQLT